MKKVLALLTAAFLFSACSISSSPDAEKTTEETEITAAEGELPFEHEFIYTVTYPDGVVFESYDGEKWYMKTFDGENWYVKSEPVEKPLIYMLPSNENVYELNGEEETLVRAIVYNNGLEETVGTSGCGGVLYYCYDNGEWDRAPYKENVGWTDDFVSLPESGFKAFDAFPENILETVNAGRYRYEISYGVAHSKKEYICSFEYSIK